MTKEEIIKQNIPNGIQNVKGKGDGKPQYQAEVDIISLCMQQYADQECAAKDKRIKELEEGLKQIAYPLKYLQEEAEKDGSTINGIMAVQICNNAEWLKEKAKQLLTPKTSKI